MSDADPASTYPTPPAAEEAPRPVPLRFTGHAGEFFRIWIVNLGLTLVTLGIYSAWAKVRTRRYLYGNLLLDGSPFEYTADPLKILIGRLIVGAGAALYAFGVAFFPPLGFALLALLFLASPWIVVRALSFNHRNTRWRNLRFAFRGSYGEAAKVYLAWPLLVGVTFGLAAPAYHGRQQAFMVANSAYGATPFSFRWRARDYYGPYLAAGFVFALGFAAMMALFALLGGGEGAQAGAQAQPAPLAFWLGTGVFALFYFVAFTIIRVVTTNLMYQGTSLPGVSFASRLRIGEMLGLYLVNTLAIAFSFGMLIPWAMIRLARYRAERVEVLASGDLASFAKAAEEAERLGAFADEAAVAFDFDFGL